MSDTRDGAGRPATVGHRLQHARNRWLLGREGELDLFRSALDAPEPPFTVLHVHGPGGVGKSALLRAFAAEARTAGAVTVPLDARHFEPSPPGFTAAVRAVAGLGTGGDLAAALGTRGRHRTVVLLDTYEKAAPLDDWLRERFLPDLPADSIMVLAGREPPGPAWRSEAAWRELPGYRWHYLARIWRAPILGELFQATSTRLAFRLLLPHGNRPPLPRAFVDRMYDEIDGGTKRAILALYRATDDPKASPARCSGSCAR